MVPTWPVGKPTIEHLIAEGQIERVAPNLKESDLLLAEATRHIRTAQTALEDGDVTGSFSLSYAAARKTLTALCSAQGLRFKAVEGAHRAIGEAVRAQFGNVLGDLAARYGRMRVIRNRSDYPTIEQPTATWVQAEDALSIAIDLLEGVPKMLDHMDRFE